MGDAFRGVQHAAVCDLTQTFSVHAYGTFVTVSYNSTCRKHHFRKQKLPEKCDDLHEAIPKFSREEIPRTPSQCWTRLGALVIGFIPCQEFLDPLLFGGRHADAVAAAIDDSATSRCLSSLC